MRQLWRTTALVGLVVPALALGVTSTAMAAEITDPTGDVTDAANAALTAPQADITTVDVKRVAADLELRYRTATPTDPLTDANWDSGLTYAVYLLDTNKDGKEDYSVDYGMLEGAIYTEVRKLDGSEDPPVSCKGVGSFVDNVATAKVPLSCFGDAKDMAFFLKVSYDTDVTAETPKVAYDFAPNSGWAQV